MPSLRPPQTALDYANEAVTLLSATPCAASTGSSLRHLSASTASSLPPLTTPKQRFAAAGERCELRHMITLSLSIDGSVDRSHSMKTSLCWLCLTFGSSICKCSRRRPRRSRDNHDERSPLMMMIVIKIVMKLPLKR